MQSHDAVKKLFDEIRLTTAERRSKGSRAEVLNPKHRFPTFYWIASGSCCSPRSASEPR